MSKLKKLLLSSVIAVTMAIAFVVGIVGLNKDNVTNKTKLTQVAYSDMFEVKQYSYDNNEVLMCKGKDNIKYSYIPGVNSKETSVVSFEYRFNNPMSTPMAINLDSIDTTGVTVSYAYSDTKLNSITNSTSPFEAQTIQPNQTKYIYVVVTAGNIASTTEFQSEISWWQGKAGTMSYVIEGNISNATIVKGQPVNEPINTDESILIAGWYLDSDHTIPATFPLNTQGQTLYAQVADGNLPSDWITWDSSTSTYTIASGSSSLPENVIVQGTHNDGTHGKANITSVSTEAFYYYDYIKSINLSKCTGLTTINTYAFGFAQGLKKVVLPTSLTTIGNNAFYSCIKLTSIDLSVCSNLTSIGENAFYGNAFPVADLRNCTNLTIISSKAFNNHTRLQTVILPPNITSIGTEAFSCVKLKNVDFSRCTKLTTINQSAFNGASLTRVDLSYCTSLKTIGNYAFNNNYRLTSIIIPSKVTSLSSSGFQNTYALAEVYNLSGLTITLGGSYGHVGYYAKVIHTSLSTPSSIITIEGVQYYKESDTSYIALAPTDNSIKYANLHPNTTSINSYAFRTCYELGYVVIPSNVTSIQKDAFYYCYGLKYIYDLSPNVTITAGGTDNGNVGQYATVIKTSLDDCIETINGVIYYKNSDSNYTALGTEDKSITSITLHPNTVEINDYAFRSYYNLASVDLSRCTKLTTIGSNAFYECSSLTSVDLSNCTSLTTIGSSAFQQCSSLTSVGDLSRCTKLTTIGSNAFSACSSLTSIVIPSGVTNIGNTAFGTCYTLGVVYNLSSLTITAGSSDNGYVANYAGVVKTSLDTENKFETINGVTYYKDSATSYIVICLADISLTSITLHANTTIIKPYAFYGKRILTEVNFTNCTKLTTIGNYAFQSCVSVTSVDLSNCTKLTIIGRSSFASCSKLISITIPASVKNIGTYAFSGSKALTSATFKQTSGWYVTTSKTSSGTSLTSTDLSDTSTAATYLISTHYTKFWYNTNAGGKYSDYVA